MMKGNNIGFSYITTLKDWFSKCDPCEHYRTCLFHKQACLWRIDLEKSSEL